MKSTTLSRNQCTSIYTRRDETRGQHHIFQAEVGTQPSTTRTAVLPSNRPSGQALLCSLKGNNQIKDGTALLLPEQQRRGNVEVYFSRLSNSKPRLTSHSSHRRKLEWCKCVLNTPRTSRNMRGWRECNGVQCVDGSRQLRGHASVVKIGMLDLSAAPPRPQTSQAASTAPTDTV